MSYDRAGLALQAVLSTAAAPGTYVNNRNAGSNPAQAVLSTATDAASNTLMSPATLGVYMMGRIAVAGSVAGFINAGNNVRRITTPFSQRYEHSVNTARLQEYGLRQMGAMRGVGSEAALMYGRTMRG